MSAFPCTSCGCCCWDVVGLLPAKPDRSCVNLAADRKTCLVYDSRPLICRVSETRPEVMTEAEWFAANTAACIKLRAHYGIEEAANADYRL